MTELTNFTFDRNSIRILVNQKVDIFFVAKDITELLGCKNHDDAIKILQRGG